jgi:sugar phosphate isomerase/epimerase
MDVCNAVNSPERFYNNGDLIDELFHKLGPWIASCHAKDLAWIPEYNVHFLEVAPGRGVMDYRRYLLDLSRLPVDAPLMLEHLKSAQEYDQGRAYIQRIAAQAGVSFA